MRFTRNAVILLLTSALASGLQGACSDDAASNNACHLNSDCASSKVAADWKNIRCPKEIYCLEGNCVGECRERCEVTRSDVNPCSAPAQCAHYGGSADDVFLCTMLPIPCTSTMDCPAYRPVLGDAGQADWTCADGECRYPGVKPPTR
jgi:hypothetical protein